jgi:hypothetical protein
MIYIFHGDNQFDSRQALNKLLEEYSQYDQLKTDSKNIDLARVNLFLQSSSLFAQNKVLIIENFFSANKSIIDKLIKVVKDSNDIDLIIWQDKALNATQLKTFPQSKVQLFTLSNKLFGCLNAVRPKNLNGFIPLYKEVLKMGLYDLFLYLIKGNLRRQLTTYSKFDQTKVKNSYLQLIELDYQNKSGQLSIPKEIALERIVMNLIK